MRFLTVALLLTLATPVLAREKCQRLIVEGVPAQQYVIARMIAEDFWRNREANRPDDAAKAIRRLAALYRQYPNAGEFALCETNTNPASFWTAVAKLQQPAQPAYTQAPEPVYNYPVPVPPLPSSGGFSCISAEPLTICRPD